MNTSLFREKPQGAIRFSRPTAYDNSVLILAQKKAPLKVFPLICDYQFSEKEPPVSGNNSEQEQETPRLKDPDESSILNSSNCIEFAASSNSFGNQSEYNSQKERRGRLKLKLHPSSRHQRPMSQPLNTNNTPSESSRSDASNTSERDRVRNATSQDDQCKMPAAITKPLIVPDFATDTDRNHFSQTIYQSYRSPGADRIDTTLTNNQPSVGFRKYAPMRALSTSPKFSDRRRSLQNWPSDCSKEEKEDNTRSRERSLCDNNRSVEISTSSVISNRCAITSPMTIGKTSDSAFARHFCSGPKGYKTKIEAFFWNPFDPKTTKRDTLPSKDLRQNLSFTAGEIPRTTKQLSYHDLGNRSVVEEPKAEKKQIKEAMGITFCKEEDSFFSMGRDQKELNSGRILASFRTESLSGTDRSTLEQTTPIDVKIFKDLIQQTSISLTNDAHKTEFKKQSTAIVTDTVTNRVDLIKLMASPRSQQLKAFSPRIKDMQRIDEMEPDWLDEMCEAQHGNETINKVRTTEISPKPRRTSFSHSFNFGVACFDDTSNKTGLQQDGSELNASAINASVLAPLRESSTTILCINCEEYIPASEAKVHSQLCQQTRSRREDNPKRSLVNSPRDLQIVNQQIMADEEKMVKLIEKWYNQGSTTHRTEKSQIFIDIAAEAAIRTAHLKLNNTDLNLIDKDLQHLGEILIRVGRHIDQKSVPQDQINDEEASLIAFVENLSKVVELAKEKREIIAGSARKQKDPPHHRAQSCGTTLRESGTRIQSSRQSVLEVCFQTQLSVPNESERVNLVQRPVTMTRNFNTSVFKPPTPTGKQESNAIKTEYMLGTKDLSKPETSVKLGASHQKFSLDKKLGMKEVETEIIESIREWDPKKNGANKAKYEAFRGPFIQLALSIRSELDPAHSSNKILVSDLVEEAFELGLAKHKWESFIRGKFNGDSMQIS